MGINLASCEQLQTVFIILCRQSFLAASCERGLSRVSLSLCSCELSWTARDAAWPDLNEGFLIGLWHTPWWLIMEHSYGIAGSVWDLSQTYTCQHFLENPEKTSRHDSGKRWKWELNPHSQTRKRLTLTFASLKPLKYEAVLTHLLLVFLLRFVPIKLSSNSHLKKKINTTQLMGTRTFCRKTVCRTDSLPTDFLPKIEKFGSFRQNVLVCDSFVYYVILNHSTIK